jgi:hypothetical protein
MPNANPAGRSARLNVEALEDRTMPAIQGVSLAAGPIFLNGLVNSGVNQFVIGSAPGSTDAVNIWNNTGGLVQSFDPFGSSTGGVTVAVGDVNVPAGTAAGTELPDDIVVGTDAGTTAHVKAFAYVNGGLVRLASFYPFGPNFTGGVNVASGVVTGANLNSTILNSDNIVVSVASDGPPRVQVYTYDANSPTGVDLVRSFLAYGPTYTGGVSLTVGSISQAVQATDAAGNLISPITAYSQIITGMAEGSSKIRIFDAQNPTVIMDASYLAFPGTTTGVDLVAGDTTGTAGVDIYVNLIGTTQVRVFVGETSGELSPTPLDTFNALLGSGSQQLSMAISGMATLTDSQDNLPDNPFVGTFFIHDFLVIAADGPDQQVPVVWGGGAKPAGFNGSQLA